MEYGLRQDSNIEDMLIERLNPCCNGIWSQTVWWNLKKLIQIECLNPCCNGIWSQTVLPLILKTAIVVVS